jgi:hypothetical protein
VVRTGFSITTGGSSKSEIRSNIGAQIPRTKQKESRQMHIL